MSAEVAPVRHLAHQEVMGTVVTFDVHTSAPEVRVREAVAEAMGWLDWVDDTFSTYKPDSEVCRFDRGELSLDACSPELREVLVLCNDFGRRTEGYFDAWATGRFDPSGLVKGWSVERASALLAHLGFPDHLVDGGGDVRLRGAPGPGLSWQVGVRHPRRRDALVSALGLSAGAVATSGTYERGAHVFDPVRSRPATELVSVTVVGPELTSADAYATAALAMGPQALAWLDGLAGYEAELVSARGEGWCTAGFDALRTVPRALAGGAA